MEKNNIVYLISVAISVFIFYVLVKRKCKLLKNKQEELKLQKETSNNLAFIFHKILGNR